jgi:hypothetical protein
MPIFRGTRHRRWVAPLLLLLACGRGAGTEANLRAALARYDSAWASKDTTAIERILAPEYIYFTSAGRLSSRAESLEFLTDTSYVLTTSRRSHVRVTVAGTVGRVSSRWEGVGRYQNEPVQDDQTCGQTWLWRGGRWVLFTEHCVNRPHRGSTGGADSQTGT